ncbi:MAG: carbamate kinase [Actinomycetota bacterium]|nr:carbamate kinase [Actinomycetota bacterium]
MTPSDRALSPLVVVALGGNAIQDPSGDDSVTGDFDRTTVTARKLVGLVRAEGCRLVITHGNGPQVGNHLLRAELAHQHAGLPLLPLDVCVADTQGGMGYMLQQCLTNAFHEHELPAVVASVVTTVVVDPEDPAFESPSKPVGEMIADDQLEAMRQRAWVLVEDRRRGGWRRVVASPDPKEIVEAAAIRGLVDQGVVVIAAGGGGIPVIHRASGDLAGVAAVIDKDLASALLAADLGAEALLLLTDVDHVSLGYDTPGARALETLTVAEARAYQADGEFGAGSMGPKVEAVCRFVAATGKLGVITSIRGAEDALSGGSGTRITPG